MWQKGRFLLGGGTRLGVEASFPNTPAKASPPATTSDYGAGPGAAATCAPVPHGHGEPSRPLRGPTSWDTPSWGDNR